MKTGLSKNVSSGWTPEVGPRSPPCRLKWCGFPYLAHTCRNRAYFPRATVPPSHSAIWSLQIKSAAFLPGIWIMVGGMMSPSCLTSSAMQCINNVLFLQCVCGRCLNLIPASHVPSDKKGVFPKDAGGGLTPEVTVRFPADCLTSLRSLSACTPPPLLTHKYALCAGHSVLVPALLRSADRRP